MPAKRSTRQKKRKRRSKSTETRTFYLIDQPPERHTFGFFWLPFGARVCEFGGRTIDPQRPCRDNECADEREDARTRS